MTDSVFQQTVDLLASFRTDASAFNTFLTGAVGVNASFRSATGEVVEIPSLRSELQAARDRIPDPAGQPPGAFIIIDAMGEPSYADVAFEFPTAGTERSNLAVTFNETAAGVRTINILSYGLPTAMGLTAGNLMTYDGANFIASSYLVQSDGYLPAPLAGTPAINRLAIVRSELLQSGTVTRTYRESSIRVPSGFELALPANQNKFLIAAEVDGEAALVQSSYQIPVDTMGTVEGSVLRVNASGNLQFSTQSLAQIIDQETPPANLDFIRVSSNYAQGRLEINRSINLPPVDVNDISTFIDGSTQQNSQAKFVSATFQFDTDESSESGELIARFLGATDEMEHYVTFGRIGVNVISSDLPWAANRDSVADNVVIYRQHDIVIHLGRRYYVEFDVTPITNPVPGTNMTEGGVTVDLSPFTAYNCGTVMTSADTPFTAVNQILYATVSDVEFLNPPADDSGFYALSLQEITLDGFARLQPFWSPLAVDTPELPPLATSLSTTFEVDRIIDLDNTLNELSGFDNRPTQRVINVSGTHINSDPRTYLTSDGFRSTAVLTVTRNYYQDIVDLQNDVGIIGWNTAAPAAQGFLGGDGELRVITAPRRISSVPARFYAGYQPAGTFENGVLINIAEAANSDFIRVYNDAFDVIFLEKSDGSLWGYGYRGRILGQGNNRDQTGTLFNFGLSNIVKILFDGLPTINIGNAPFVLFLDSNGAMYAAGLDPITPLADSNNTNNTFGAARQILTDLNNIVDFQIDSYSIGTGRTICIAMLRDDGRVITHFNTSANWNGTTTGVVGQQNLLPLTDVLDIGFPSNTTSFSNTNIFLLRDDGLYQGNFLQRVELPRNSGWVRVEDGGVVIDQNGRRAIRSSVTNTYRYV